MDSFDTPQTAASRSEYLETWRRTERFTERVGGVVFILAGGFLLTADPTGDPFILFATPGLVAAGLALILRRRRVALAHIHLSYLDHAQLASRALLVGLGGAVALFAGVTLQIFTLFVGGALAVGLGVWYQWRARKAREYEALFNQSPTLAEVTAQETEE